MRAFTRIAAATALAAGLTVSGAGSALANTSTDEGSRPLGVLGTLLGGWFEEDPGPEDAPQEESPEDTTAPEETGGSGQESPEDTTVPEETGISGQESPDSTTVPNEQSPSGTM